MNPERRKQGMGRLSDEQRRRKNAGRSCNTVKEAAEIFNNRQADKAIHFTTVRYLIDNFKSSGSVNNKEHRAWITNEDIETDVMQSVVENPKYSLRKRSSLLNISKTTVARILKTNKFKPYKPQCTHTLKEGADEQRFEFCARIKGKLEDDRFITRHILFSDEATPRLRLMVFKHNTDLNKTSIKCLVLSGKSGIRKLPLSALASVLNNENVNFRKYVEVDDDVWTRDIPNDADTIDKAYNKQHQTDTTQEYADTNFDDDESGEVSVPEYKEMWILQIQVHCASAGCIIIRRGGEYVYGAKQQFKPTKRKETVS
ncbi:transposable element tc3 transposase-like protein [Holotrichia oblita]|uniref:Transposable element tc3 transposase-like protein n=1 Tax=Holotrichia oblita TaxID=644536 RepID=A0ACB9SLE0_HOLOL|nr:transposable element tc3 transposase-like protein [Holotrichia oblita]